MPFVPEAGHAGFRFGAPRNLVARTSDGASLVVTNPPGIAYQHVILRWNGQGYDRVTTWEDTGQDAHDVLREFLGSREA